MKKSRSVTLTLMASLAAACSNGAGRSELDSSGTTSFTAADTVRRCVDSTYQVVADEQCAGPRTSGGYYPYFFYFGGRTLVQGGGTYVSGGSRTMPSVRGPVSRGGIGATGARTGRIGA